MEGWTDRYHPGLNLGSTLKSGDLMQEDPVASSSEFSREAFK